MTTESLNDLREKALSLLALQLAHEGMGVYCQEVHKADGTVEKRGPYGEGWNAYSCELLNKQITIESWLEALPIDSRAYIQDFLLDGTITLHVDEDKKISMMVNCNDLFWWGCADQEDIEIEELADLQKAYADSPKHGDILWVCRKRGMRPQKPYYKYFNVDEKPLFDAAGPERTDA